MATIKTYYLYPLTGSETRSEKYQAKNFYNFSFHVLKKIKEITSKSIDYFVKRYKLDFNEKIVDAIVWYSIETGIHFYGLNYFDKVRKRKPFIDIIERLLKKTKKEVGIKDALQMHLL